MKETKSLLLEGDEVDEYWELEEKFNETVNEAVKRDLDRKKGVRFFWYTALGWITLYIILKIFGVN